MKLNKEQSAAVNADINKNVLISAGAGSGKTNTLKEKVYKIISNGEIKPSELLVLTFTNAAAHEMKERIINKFVEEKSKFADEMLSAHIQTFDSFSQYLVTENAAELGLSSNISVANDSVLTLKISELIDEIFIEYKNDPDNFERITKSAAKFSSSSDLALKNNVKYVYNELSKMSEIEKEDFLNNYENKYLDRDFFDKFADDYFKSLIYSFDEIILDAYYLERITVNYINNNDSEKIYKEMNDPNFYNASLDNIIFNNTKNNELLNIYKDLRSLPRDEFVGRMLNLDDFYHIKSSKRPSVKNDSNSGKDSDIFMMDKKTLDTIWDNIFLTPAQRTKFYERLTETEFNKQYDHLISFKDDINLIFEIVKKLDARLKDYKKTTNMYTFQDISNMAVDLVSNPKYEGTAEKIRSRFKFIMVDEYQDTNDAQEVFINSLLKPNREGKCAHLFCVGDAKQSIYGFRNSKVELFRKRQELYSHSKDGSSEVICMNKNYRSGQLLLDEINEIFTQYMTLNHGGISYLEKGENLDYDIENPAYPKYFENFGIEELVFDSKCYGKNSKDKEDINTKEAKAIACDIINKINSHYKVYDRKDKNGIRDCTFSDFCILVRNKPGYSKYQQVFKDLRIPLNVVFDDDLKEFNVMMTIRSVFTYLNAVRTNYNKADYKHLYMSIARSYLFEISDQEIYDLISSNNFYEKLKETEIHKMIVELDNETKDSNLVAIFNKTITKFEIISKLNKVGKINENANKIESIYDFVLNQTNSGNELSDFVEFLKDISKYDIPLDVTTNISDTNSVDLMTIHKSKGLERKIVYLPYSYNKPSRPNHQNAPKVSYSKKYGLIFDYYGDPTSDKFSNDSVDSILKDIKKFNEKEKNEELNEHVRLNYVSLTRAENKVIIVHDREQNNEKESLLDMLATVNNFKLLDNWIRLNFERKIDNDKFIRYCKDVNSLINNRFTLTRENFTNDFAYKFYSNRARNLYAVAINSSIDKFFDYLKKLLTDELINEIQNPKREIEKIRMVLLWLQPQYAFLIKDVQDYAGFAGFLDTIDAWEEANSFNFYSEDGDDEEENFDNFDGESELDEVFDEDEEFEDDEEEFDPYYLEFKEICESKDIDRAQDFVERYYSKIINVEVKNHVLESSIKEATLNKALKSSKEEYFKLILEKYLANVLYLLDLSGNPSSIFTISHASNNFSDEIKEISIYRKPILENLNDSNITNDIFNEIIVNNDDIEFKERCKKHASKALIKDEENPIEDLLELGTHLHLLMELVDFNNPDLSYIKNEKEREIIKNTLDLQLFRDLRGGEFKSEFGYYDEILATTGFIDLLVIKDGIYYIIDYKTKNIDDEHYDEQLNIYKRNVNYLFGVSEDKIKMYLVSLVDNKVREVK